MGIDPLKIEDFFNETLAGLKVSTSERSQLYLIQKFLKRLNGRNREYESYLIQVLDYLPSMEYPLLFTGMHPKYLQLLLDDLEKAIDHIPELKQDEEFLKKLDWLREGLNLLFNWLGEDKTGTKVAALYKFDNEIGGRKKDFGQGEVLVPVVEAYQQGSQKGRLRTLKVELMGESSSKNHQIKPVFGVIGADAGTIGYNSVKAADNLLKENIQSSKRWSATAAFELSHAWHAGHSANLALAGLFYCEVLKKESKREYFQLNPAIAVTGDIEEKGKVKAVAASTIKQKVEAAFFSWAQVLVVPVEQLEQASSHVDELRKEYPNRHLAVKGIGELRELFFDRRLTLYKKTPLVEYVTKKAYAKRKSTVVIGVFLILLLIIAKLVYGPIDKNPVSVEYGGDQYIFQNKSGSEIALITAKYEEDIEVSERLDEPVFEFYDITGDGINEVIYAEGLSRQAPANSILKVRDVNSNELIWESNFAFDVEFPRQQGMDEMFFYVSETAIAIDKNNTPVLVVRGDASLHFPGIVAKYDLSNGKLLGYYLHSGNINDMEIMDLDDDSTDEIFITGVNNAFWSAYLAVLDIENVLGHSPVQGDYIPKNIKSAKEYAYILMPRTSVGEAFSDVYKFNVGRVIRKKKDLFWVEVFDTPPHEFMGVENQGFIVYTFNHDLSVQSIVSSDDYDVVARNLYNEGHISFIPDYGYFEAFKDSLLFWNGEEFVMGDNFSKQ
ncbi:hypothetical protein [Gracilimonas mengyeensis]|uniref:Uncharacterized protein n=1 Tax=Gracilimonas mengyeensis TaxID=1302730 RepID=A0A521BU33_9BACT|nr:hypothetical protein [Gracilimonas mengyeensis]SMO50667.1 hypothetical protein SAMN06265219_10394 [Gracilimonas mengyeensis]